MKKTFQQKVLAVVKKIPRGKILTYQEVAKKAGQLKAYRVVGNILAKNSNQKIPCHRVVNNDFSVGGYRGSKENSWLKLAYLLKEGVVAVMPTDTIYGICGLALNRKIVERIYKLRKRRPDKPMIILIGSLEDLKIFKIKLTKAQKNFLKKWPERTSVILRCENKKFAYLHRGTKTLAFRLPQGVLKNKFLLKILKITGPLVAPSANLEGEKPAQTIFQAWRYFKNNVIYYDGGKIIGKPSKIIDLTGPRAKIIRK